MAKCLLQVSKTGVTPAEFNSLKELSDCIESPGLLVLLNKSIEDDDYIELHTNSGHIFQLIANVDTYYDQIGKHHIDFISKQLIPVSLGVKMRDKNTNNGNIVQRSPYMISNVYNSLIWYYENEIPVCIKSNIIDKYVDVVERYNPNQPDKLMEYNNSDNINNLGIGHLWIPYAEEVFDRFITVTMSIGNFNQYNSLKSINNRTKKIITDDIDRNNSWWTASASNGSSTSYVIVNENGQIDNAYATTQTLGVPLCFRFV